MTNTVGYLGIPGSFSYLAGRRYFDNQIKLISSPSFEQILTDIKKHAFDYGILPIENSVSGSVVKNYDLLRAADIVIIGEVYLRISQNLVAKKKVDLKYMRSIYSHPEAFKQCEEFLSTLNSIRVEMSDTATAAKYVSEKGKDTDAAIASIDAAKRYNLKVLKKHIETNKANYTRFIVVAKKINGENAANKITVLFTVRHKPGTLYRALGALAKRSLNLTKIESRPMLGSPFEYMFYMI